MDAANIRHNGCMVLRITPTILGDMMSRTRDHLLFGLSLSLSLFSQLLWECWF